MPQQVVLAGIVELHQTIFGDAGTLISKLESKPSLTVVVAKDKEIIIGYKIGYEMDRDTYYSWLGGVNPNYRKKGIASKLMDVQHQYLRGKGYQVIQTKTMNRWRNMLLLNIKHGFDIIDTCTDEKGLHKIILEKHLAISKKVEE